MKNNENFSELGLSPELLLAVEKSGFTEPTRIQEITLPQILEGKDLLIEAQTGSGKTACFAWPLLQKISADQERNKKSAEKEN